MNEKGNVMYAKVHYHFENVPKFMRGFMSNEFMKNRGKVVDIFNTLIDSVNAEWNSTGKPCAFGEFAEDINPEYVKFIQDKIQPFIDVLNKQLKYCRYRIDEVGDIIGFIPFIKKSKLWITLKFVES